MDGALRPVIGITANVDEDCGRERYTLRRDYAAMVVDAGGAPVILPHEAEMAALALRALDGVIISGGDDIDVRDFGLELHPKASVMPARRQRGEFALLRSLDERPEIPLLGICLGMQLLGVHRGARLIQHLDDVLPDAARHRDNRLHRVETRLGSGMAASSHHQALADAGSLEVIGLSDDGVIEAVRDPSRPFVVGVQWHPERTEDETLGVGVIRALVDAARERMRARLGSARVTPAATETGGVVAASAPEARTGVADGCGTSR